MIWPKRLKMQIPTTSYNGYEEMNSKVKDWMPPYVMIDFTDHKKQKHLVVVVVVFPLGDMHYNTANMDIEVESTQDKLQIKIIWPNNIMDVMKLLSQFPHTWHVDDIIMQQHLVREKAINQLREKAMDFIWSMVSIPLPFIVQSKFNFEFIYDHDNRFCTLMIHLVEPDRKYKGGMQHRMIQI